MRIEHQAIKGPVEPGELLHHLGPQPPCERRPQVDNFAGNSPRRAIDAAVSGETERASFHLATGEWPGQDRQQQRQARKPRRVKAPRYPLPKTALVDRLAACAYVRRAAMRERVAKRRNLRMVIEQERKKRCAVVRRTDDEDHSQQPARCTIGLRVALPQLLRVPGSDTL
jgi:hypothetical protein